MFFFCLCILIPVHKQQQSSGWSTEWHDISYKCASITLSTTAMSMLECLYVCLKLFQKMCVCVFFFYFHCIPDIFASEIFYFSILSVLLFLSFRCVYKREQWHMSICICLHSSALQNGMNLSSSCESTDIFWPEKVPFLQFSMW